MQYPSNPSEVRPEFESLGPPPEPRWFQWRHGCPGGGLWKSRGAHGGHRRIHADSGVAWAAARRESGESGECFWWILGFTGYTKFILIHTNSYVGLIVHCIYLRGVLLKSESSRVLKDLSPFHQLTAQIFHILRFFFGVSGSVINPLAAFAQTWALTWTSFMESLGLGHTWT